MTYLYNCSHCKADRTIEKPMSESNKAEVCKWCNTEMVRVYNTGIRTTDGFKGSK